MAALKLAVPEEGGEDKREPDADACEQGDEPQRFQARGKALGDGADQDEQRDADQQRAHARGDAVGEGAHVLVVAAYVLRRAARALSHGVGAGLGGRTRHGAGQVACHQVV